MDIGLMKKNKIEKSSLIDKWINQLWYVCVCVNAKQAEVEWFNLGSAEGSGDIVTCHLNAPE